MYEINCSSYWKIFVLYTENVYNTNMEKFTSAIKQLREKRGLNQADFARILKVTQQTVSRWESGASRPREKDLAKISALFPEFTHEEWHKLSGRISEPVRPLNDYIPLYALSPDKFEQFCVDFVRELYPKAIEVHRYGTQGFKQDGIDLHALFPDKSIFSFQCKRRQKDSSFGPAEIRKIIKDTTFKAKENFIFLSKVASPESRDEILKHKLKWHLYDIYDISDKLRALPRPAALRLIDIYFPGHRMDFLGELEPGSWITAKDYFAKFVGKEILFRQDWNLIGRQNEVSKLMQHIKSDKQIFILSGRGGTGKTKILKEFVDSYASKESESHIYFALPGTNLGAKDLENLPDNSILVIDDVHERSDLNNFLNSIAFRGAKYKIILSTRPYGLERVKVIAVSSGLGVDEMSLDGLTTEESTLLARAILTEYKGPEDLAPTIASLSKDCPLITVLASRILSQEQFPPGLLNNSASFREVILSRFYDVVTGVINDTEEKNKIKLILELIALIQPIATNDQEFVNLSTAILKEDWDVINRRIRFLEDSGVLLRRGKGLRVVPDLLADYIRERSCYNSNDKKSTGYADRIYKSSGGKLKNNLLINLSQLDWRISAEGVQSTLLNEVWENIAAEFDTLGIWQRKELLESIKDIAYFQPHRMLGLVKYALGNPTNKSGLDSKIGAKFTYSYVIGVLPEILRDIAYNPNYLDEACELLWTLSFDDTRPTNQFPEHPLRILTEMIGIEPNKSIIYSEKVLALTLKWIKDPLHGTNAFQLLDKMLETASYQTETIGYTISMKPFFVSPTAVDPLRKQVLETAFYYLINGDINVAARALQTISEALRYPMPIGGASTPEHLKAEWKKRIIEVLIKIKEVLENNKIDPILLIEILNDISWHLNYSKDETKEYATKIKDILPDSLEFKINLGLMDDWGWSFREDQVDLKKSQQEWDDWTTKVANETIEKYIDQANLIDFLEERVQKMTSSHFLSHATHTHFIGALIKVSPDFGITLGNYIIQHPKSVLVYYFNLIIPYLERTHKKKEIELVALALSSENSELKRQVAISFSWGLVGSELVEENNLKTLRLLINSEDTDVKISVINSLSRVISEDKSLGLELILDVDFKGSFKVASEVLSEFVKPGELSIGDLSQKDIDKIMKMLLECSSVDDYYLKGFLRTLSEINPGSVIDLFERRIKKSIKIPRSKGDYHPLPFVFERDEPFNFSQSVLYEDVLRNLRDWIYDQPNVWQYEYFGKNLFSLVAGNYNGTVLKILDEWVTSGSSEKLINAAELLTEAPRDFILANSTYIISLLNNAQLFGEKTLDKVMSFIMSGIISGSKSGTPGEPFPEDIEIRRTAESLIRTLPLLSPARKLYEEVYRVAERDIARSLEERFE